MLRMRFVWFKLIVMNASKVVVMTKLIFSRNASDKFKLIGDTKMEINNQTLNNPNLPTQERLVTWKVSECY